MKPGDPVYHKTKGPGVVKNRWGSLRVNDPEGKTQAYTAPCFGVFDVVFPDGTIHSCHEQYLSAYMVGQCIKCGKKKSKLQVSMTDEGMPVVSQYCEKCL